MSLTRRDIDAGDGEAAVTQLLDDDCELRPRRALEAEPKEGVDDKVERVSDEFRLRGQIREERDVHLLTLRRQVVQQRLVGAFWVEDGWVVALKPKAQSLLINS